MTNLDKHGAYLRSKGALNPSIPSIVQLAVDTINTEAVPSMKIAIAISELTTFSSHLRKPIQFNEKLIVPTNAITYILSRSGCVDPDTEYLTPTGWKRIADYTPGDTVLQWAEDLSTSFETPLEYVDQPTNTLYSYSNKYTNMVVSDAHNVALLSSPYNNTKPMFTKYTGKQLREKETPCEYTLPFNFNSPKRSGLPYTDDQIRLHIAFAADSSIQNYSRLKSSKLVRIRVKHEYKKIRLRELLTSVYGTIDERVTDSELEYSRFYFEPPIKKEKSLDMLWEASPHQLQVIADEVHKWDGCTDTRPNKSLIYRTTKKSEADFIQYVWRCVYEQVVSLTVSPERPGHTEVYMVRRTNFKRIGTKNLSVTKTSYQREYCFTMPNGNWVARKDGGIYLTHNSAKDSSVNAVRTAMKNGYDTIKSMRQSEAKSLAQQKCADAGEELTEYPKYMRVLRALMPELGTLQGCTAHYSMLSEGSIGAGFVSTSELGSDMLSNGDMPLIMTLLAKSYDLGNIPATIVKGDEHQVDEIMGFPVNALMFGTESVILYDSKVKAMFRQSFSAQSARRANFSFHPQVVPNPMTNLTADEEIDEEERIEQLTFAAQATLATAIDDLVQNTSTEPLQFSAAASRLFKSYLKYNKAYSEQMPAIYPISEIARKHMQWRAMKLSGVLAIYDRSEVITEQHYVQAINIVELFSNDLMMFERELIKEPYEQFADFMLTIVEDSKSFISIHNLRKLGYINSSSEARMIELAKSATSYDPHGIFSVAPDGIHYEYLEPTAEVELPFSTSYLAINDDMSAKFTAIYQLPSGKQKKAKDDYKQYLGSIIASGYESVQSSFDDISIALSSNAAISNYLFTDGVRGKDRLINSTNWLLFDIDTSTLSIDSVHFILQDLNHHLVRGSDDNNDYKYHLAIELSTTLTIEPRLWKHFMQSVATYLGIQHDALPQSQVMFCYGERTVLSVVDQSPLEIKDHLLYAQAQVTAGPVKELTPTQKKKLLENSFGTFQYAFECVDNGSRNLIRAAYHAQELGMNSTEIVELVTSINDYWDYPMDTSRLEKTLLSQIRQW